MKVWLQWQILERVHPFFRLGRLPDHQEFFDRTSDRYLLSKKEDPWTLLGRNKNSEMHRHRVVIVRNQYPALACCYCQDFRVWKSTYLSLVGVLEVNGRFTPEQSGDNDLIEVCVSLKLDFHG
jgi:hypothetical protein